jgi:hypothetical protein
LHKSDLFEIFTAKALLMPFAAVSHPAASALAAVVQNTCLMSELLSFLHYWDMRSAIRALVRPSERAPYRRCTDEAFIRDCPATRGFRQHITKALKQVGVRMCADALQHCCSCCHLAVSLAAVA